MVAGHAGGVGGEDGEAVRRGHDEIAAEDHVAVGIAVGGSAEVGRLRAAHGRDQLGGVRGVGVGVMAAEVLQRLAVDHRAGRRTEHAFEDRAGVGPADGAHRVEAHAPALGEPGAHGVEVEQLLHQRRIVGHRVDDLDLHVADALRPEVSRSMSAVSAAMRYSGQDAAARVDRLGDALGAPGHRWRCWT